MGHHHSRHKHHSKYHHKHHNKGDKVAQRKRWKERQKEKSRLSYENKSYGSSQSFIDQSNQKVKKKISKNLIFTILIVIVSIILLFIHPLLFFVELGILIIIWIYGYMSSCPNCKKHFAKRRTEKEILERYTDTVVKDNIIQHRDNQGNPIGTSTNKVYRPVSMIVAQNHYKCKYCNHEWIGKLYRQRG